MVRKQHLAMGGYKIVRSIVKLSVFGYQVFFSKNSYLFSEKLTFVANTQVERPLIRV